MKRGTLIYKIVQTLNDEGALDVNNYPNNIAQCIDVQNIIERVLDNVVLIEGSVIE